ncbi:hypothetical protein [Parapedobacter sp.]
MDKRTWNNPTNKVNLPFGIWFTDPVTGKRCWAAVYHETETFDVDLGTAQLSLINNGDNSWSAVENLLDQETVNEIGSAIEGYYAELNP